MNTPTDNANLRRHDRKNVLFAARMLIGDTAVDCEIINISFGGVQIRTRRKLTKGQTFVLDIDPFGLFEAEVRWYDDGDVGIKFLGDQAKVSELVMAIATYA